MKRGRRWWLIAVIALIIIAGGVAGFLLLHRHRTAAVHYLTSTAINGTISRTVQADFTLASSRSTTTLNANQSSSSSSSSAASSSSSASTVSSSQTGVVTALALKPGQKPRTLERLLTVSGAPVYAFVSAVPLYENLSVNLTSGTDEVNVKALQSALKSRGYYTGSVDGGFGSATQSAFEAWQTANDLTATGVLDTSQFVWVPAGAVLDAWQVGLGSQLSGGTTLAGIDFPGQLEAQALVSQADISLLKAGQKAALTIDGDTSEPFTGTIALIDSQPASSGASSSSSGSVEYTVTVAVKGLPTLARSGMTGTLVVTIAQRANVLLIPTSAVSGSGTSTYVRVMMNGKIAYRQISTGMATSSQTQVTSGLAAGEVVVTGQYTNSTTSTGSGGGLSLPGLGGGGGTFRRNSQTGTQPGP